MPAVKGTKEGAAKAVKEMEKKKPRGPRSAVTAMLPELARLYGEGYTPNELAAHLAKHGVEVKPNTIWKYLRDKYGLNLKNRARRVFTVELPEDLVKAIQREIDLGAADEQEAIVAALYKALLPRKKPQPKDAQGTLL